MGGQAMRMVQDNLLAYLREWEAGTLRQLERWAEMPATSVSFYGRVAPPVAGVCEGAADWSLSGYGSTAALLDLGKRWGSEVLRAWLRRNVRKFAEVTPWFFQTFGKPPGENAALPGVCGWTEDAILAVPPHGRDGDTDIKRHWNAYGLFRAAVDPWLMDGTWSLDDICHLADLHLAWIRGREKELVEQPRQVLRYGNDLDTLAAIARVYWEARRPWRALETYQVLDAFCRVVFADGRAVRHAVPDGVGWLDWNKGGLFKDANGRWRAPFPYGYYPYGHQAWYRGHILVALKHAIELCEEIADPNGLAPFLKPRYLAISRWIDPRERAHAPLAPDGPDATTAAMFHNSHLGGGFLDPAHPVYLRAGELEATLADWAAVGEDQPFRRFGSFCGGAGIWCSDGGYWETEIRDGDGGVHRRAHDGGTARVWECRLPGFEAANWYGCLDGLAYRAKLLKDAELADWALLATFHYLAFCNSSDSVVRLSRRLPAGITESAAFVGRCGRSFHWSLQAGSELRGDLLRNHRAVAA